MLCKRTSNSCNSTIFFLFLILLLSTSVALYYVNIRLQIFPKNYIPCCSYIHSLVNKPLVAKVFLESDTNNTMFSGDFRRSPNTQAASSTTSSHRLIARENLGAKYAVIEPDHQLTNPPEHQRTSLLIYGADRSGTTFTTKMFAEDLQLFTVYEPLWITSQWNEEDPTEVAHWKRNILDVLRGILSCKFADSQAGTKFLSYTQKQWSGAFVKNPFTSDAFCKGTCLNLTNIPEFVDKVCLSKYKHSVTKIGEPRVPDGLLSAVIPDLFLENPETDVRVIQLVRDPRGSFNSRIKLRWMEEYHNWRFPNTVAEQCSKLAQNIKFGRNLPSKFRVKYLEVHYEDLAKHPIETTRNMYRFAGFKMSPSIHNWVQKNTSPSEKELLREKKDVFSSVRNSSTVADQWRQEAPIERTRVIEKYCKEAFHLLGLQNIYRIN